MKEIEAGPLEDHCEHRFAVCGDAGTSAPATYQQLEDHCEHVTVR
jgi:hypothetical protein